MTKSLKMRKQELVRVAIYDAAMDLFSRKGFNETTVDEIAEAAGISQRSFFRYFPTKSDVLAYDIAGAGDVVVAAVEGCPRGLSGLEVVRRAALANIEYAISRPRTRQIIEITAQNFPVRQAHRAALVEVENRVSEAYAARMKNSGKYGLGPRMLTLLTQMVVDLTLTSWFFGEAKDCESGLTTVFDMLTRLFCERDITSTKGMSKPKQRKHMSTRPARELVLR
jgi:AcrR family transcriptional regulator